MTRKLTKAQQNDEFMRMMRAKGNDTIFVGELPFPDNTRNCQLILGRNGRLLIIRDEVLKWQVTIIRDEVSPCNGE